MANEIEAVDLPENNEEVLDLEVEEEEAEKPAPKEKPKLTPEQQLAIHRREIKKLEKSLGHEPEVKSQPKEKASSDLDYGQKAFLKTYGIQGSDELALAKTFMARTGDDLDTIVSDDIFLGKLNSLRAAREAAAAVPKGIKRSSQPAQNDADVALATYRETGKLPEDNKLAREVLNKHLEAEKSNNFAPNPVVYGGSAI